MFFLKVNFIIFFLTGLFNKKIDLSLQPLLRGSLARLVSRVIGTLQAEISLVLLKILGV